MSNNINIGNAGTVTNTGTLTANSLLVGDGGSAVKTLTTGANVATALGVAVGNAGAFLAPAGAPVSGGVVGATGAGVSAWSIAGAAGEMMRWGGVGATPLGSGAATVNSTLAVTTSLNVPIIFPPSDSTTALKINKADGTTTVVTVNTTNKYVGIGVTPALLLDIQGYSGDNAYIRLARFANTADAITIIKPAGALSTSNAQFSFGIAGSTSYFTFQRYDGTNVFNAIAIPSSGVGVGVGGVTAPTAVLHLAAGTAAASTAPEKFTSGPVLTSPEAGAQEFLTDDYYATITTGAARKIYAWQPSQLDQTASRALDTTYTNTGNRAMMVSATVRCAVTLAGGNAYVQGKSDSSTPPTTVASGLVGIQAGLLGEDNSFQLSFVVAPGMKYRIDSSTTNGTCTKGSWFEVTY